MIPRTRASIPDSLSELKERRAVQRRVYQRYTTLGTQVLLGWWERTTFCTTQATLQDISLRGAAAVSEVSPPTGIKVVIRLANQRLDEWVEAVVIEGGGGDPSGGCDLLIRLKFQESCPYAFFTGAINGGGPSEPRPAGPDRREGHYEVPTRTIPPRPHALRNYATPDRLTRSF